jgi:integrase
LVDEQKSESTARSYVALVKRVWSKIEKPITVHSLRVCLKHLKAVYSRDHYALTVSALKAYIGRHKQTPQLVSTFKFLPKIVKPKIIPSKEELRRFYHALPSIKMKAYFLLTASSGLRKGEVLSLRSSEVNFKLRMLTPNNHKGSTKYCWVSFYNKEAEKILMKFRSKLTKKEEKSQKILPISSRDFKKEWKIAKKRTNLNITSKVLRDWFAEETGKLGVSDRYVDAFQGRTPKSVLARHYTDYSPEKLKEIYDKADLKLFY